MLAVEPFRVVTDAVLSLLHGLATPKPLPGVNEFDHFKTLLFDRVGVSCILAVLSVSEHRSPASGYGYFGVRKRGGVVIGTALQWLRRGDQGELGR